MLRTTLDQVRWYYGKHGALHLGKLALDKFIDRYLRRSEYVFFVDLTRDFAPSLREFESIAVISYRDLGSIPAKMLDQICNSKSRAVAMPFLTRYFRRGARLWLGIVHDRVVGLQWTVKGGFAGFYSLPIPPEDEIMVAIETFQEFRGHAYFQKLMKSMLQQLRAEGVSRLYFKVHSHNWPMLRAVRKIGFVPVGRVTTFSLPFRHVSIWRKQFSFAEDVRNPTAKTLQQIPMVDEPMSDLMQSQEKHAH